MQAVKLDDDLHRELKIMAATDRTTVKDLVQKFLRQGLTRVTRKATLREGGGR